MSQFSLDVSDAEFDSAVVAASHDVPVIVDFWAPWCQPCRVLKPLLEKLAEEYGGRFRLVKINSDDNPASARRCAVRGIPAVKAFVGGEQVDEFTGALPESQVREFINRILPSPAEPLRQAALAARAAGELETAGSLLADALTSDPDHVASLLDAADLQLAINRPEAATQFLDAAKKAGSDPAARARLDALRARVTLLMAAGNSDLTALRSAVETNPADLSARLQLAGALAVAEDYRAAFEQLLAIVQADRKWNDEAGRKNMLTLFNALSGQEEHAALVREFRVQLSRTLN